MTDQSDIVKKINRLYQLWGYEGADIATTSKASEAANPDPGAATELADPAVSEMSVADLRATWPKDYHDDDFADDGDVEYVDAFDSNQVEMLRLELKAIDDPAELSHAFLNGRLWRVPEL